MDRGYEGAEALTTSIARSHLPVSKRAAPYTKFPTGASVGGGVRRTVATSTACPKAMQREKPWAVEDYTLLREIGKGSASVVHHAICKKSHCPVALKIYKKAQLTDVTRCQVERETRIHVGLQHRNILQCYGVFEDADAIYMVLEFAAGGDLMKVLTDNQRLTERQTIDVLRDLLAALEYLHGRAVIHRDIKPENILFTRQGILKLADFGSAIDVQKERPVSRLGTLDYMAPEVIRCPDKRSPDHGGGDARHGLQYCAKVDIWAVGILTFELLTGSPPFEQDTMEATVQSILSMQEQFPTFVSEPARRFVRHVLHKEPEVRPTVAQILLDRFLTDPPGSQPQDDRSLGELVLPQKISRIQSCSGLSGKASGDPSNMYRIPSSPYPHRMAVMRPPPEGAAPRSPDEAPPRYSPPSAAMPVPLPSAWSAPQQPHPQPAPAAMGWRPPYGAPRPPQPWYAQPSAAAQSGGRAREQAAAVPPVSSSWERRLMCAAAEAAPRAPSANSWIPAGTPIARVLAAACARGAAPAKRSPGKALRCASPPSAEGSEAGAGDGSRRSPGASSSSSSSTGSCVDSWKLPEAPRRGDSRRRTRSRMRRQSCGSSRSDGALAVQHGTDSRRRHTLSLLLQPC